MNKKKILLIEDTPDTIDFITSILSDANYNVFISTNGESAVSKAEINLPDLILLDILMPGIDGFETCKRLKSNNNTKDIPVIFISALAESFDKVKAFQLGAVDYITKPVNIDELLARVNTHIELRNARQKIEESENELKTIIENQGEGFGRTDFEENFIFANPAAEKIFGVSENSLIGRNLKDFFDEEQFIKIKQETELRKAGTVNTYELTITRPDKQKRHLLVTASPDYDKNKKIIGTIGTFRDITIRKEAEDALKNINITLEQKVNERTKQLKESEKKFRDLFNQNPSALWEEDFSEVKKLLDVKKKAGVTNFNKYFNDKPDFVYECISKIKVLNVNQASLDIYKAPNKEYLINNFAKTFNEKSIKLFKSSLDAIAEGKYNFREETEINNLQGEVFPAIVHSSVIENSERILVSITDISKRKKAEEALQERENILRTIVSETSNKSDQEYFNALTIILSETLGADYVLVGVPTDSTNKKIRTISICDKDKILDNFEYELKGTPCNNVVGNKLCVYKKNVAERFPEDDLLKQMKIEAYAGVPLFSSNKKVIGILVCLFQYTVINTNFIETIMQIFANRTSLELERLDIIDNLRQKNIELSKLNTAVEQSANIVVITDKQGIIEYVNQRFEKVTGYSKEEAIGKNPKILNSGKHSKKYYKQLWTTINSGKTWTGEFHNKKKNGDLHWELATITPVLNHKGEITNFIGIKEDITKQKIVRAKIIKCNNKCRGRRTGAPGKRPSRWFGAITVGRQTLY